MNADAYIDAKGWLCPRPVIEARLYLERLGAGETLLISLTDPHGPVDFEVFCQRSGHRLLECLQEAVDVTPIWRILIQKSA